MPVANAFNGTAKYNIISQLQHYGECLKIHPLNKSKWQESVKQGK
jgi:hypothetical protein